MLHGDMFVGGRWCPETVSSRAVMVEDRGTSVCDIQFSASLLLTHTHTHMHWCKTQTLNFVIRRITFLCSSI